MTPVQVASEPVWFQPVVTAAIVAACAALLVMVGNAIISSILHAAKIKADGELAREKFDFDKALAERKVSLDAAITSWKRKYEFAEAELAGFYEARSLIEAIRSPMAYSSENEDRTGRDEEIAHVREARDRYYPVLRRARSHSEFFNGFHARRYRARALLGPTAEQPYLDIWRILNEVSVAAGMLMRPDIHVDHPATNAQRERMENRIWEGLPEDDDIGRRLLETIANAESVLQPLITDLPAQTP